MFEVNANDVSAWGPATVPIGRPLSNTEIYILDEHSQPLPIGVAGELCVGGIGLCQGYFNQPEQTKAKFIAHPFSKDGTTRLYRTGDLVRFLPGGNIEFFGRIDHQIKIRGFRVEPGEIQAAIEKHPDVSQAVVLPYSEDGENRLSAYITSKAHLTAAGLRAFLLPLLPEYMIPSRFVTLDRFPLNANGKLDVHALAEARETTGESAHEGSEPRTPEEIKLAAIWSEVLKKPCLDVHASFFLLGGHSLLAAQIVARMRDVFNVQFPLHGFPEDTDYSGASPENHSVSACRKR
jgi:acyl-CoA synthetase (AMP-forming)/AMP-acid ligase II